jgi:FkbM family methyltransferase
MNFYSQQGEDIYIYRNFINKQVPDGIFVELGAMNGITYSNTKFFEDTLLMSGTLIEPTSQYFELVKNRPNCKNYNKAVHNVKEKVKFLGNYATAGLVETMHENFRNNWHKNSAEYYVEGEPFSDILKSSNITYIDFLSIDVEGGEEVVLKTMDFNIPVYIICIELDGHNKEKDERCRQILRANGFLFDRRFCINEFWYNNNYYRKDLLFDRSLQKPFENINELGRFHCLEGHCVDEIIRNL